MLFNSYEFIFIFLPMTFCGYFLIGAKCPPKIATAWLTLASLAFYGYWDLRYVPLLLASVFWNFLFGIKIAKAVGTARKSLLAAAIAGNLLLLGYYKYTGFFLGIANDCLGTSFAIPTIILPLGISFFTFTQTAYLIDIYRRDAEACGFLDYLLFVTIFPHLIAGPILSPRDMLPQFSNKKLMALDYRNIAVGLALFSLGLFKKVVIADHLAKYADAVFNLPQAAEFADAWLGALAYSFQLYFDFSGYSEMAVGLGLFFNMRLPQNFDSPYQAASITDFWRRWHMTLGAWVKNYLYIPLGGGRQGFGRKLANLFVAMALVGLWHGAGWTFIAWGALHGLYLVIDNLWRKHGVPLGNIVNHALTFLAVVCAWVLFRADNMATGLHILGKMFDIGSLFSGGAVGIFGKVQDLSSLSGAIAINAAILLLLFFLKNPYRYAGENFRPDNKWLALTAAAFIYSVWKLNNLSYFIYFRF